MSINIVNDFQLTLYNRLMANQKLTSQISQIYLSLAQNAKYPFLLINILQIDNLSRFENFIYQIKFEICAYARDRTIDILTNIAQQIISIIKSDHAEITTYKIIGIQSGVINFERSKDLLTTKMSINYQALLTSA